MKRWIVILVVLGACSNDGYPDSFRESFMATCNATSGGENAYCGCALEHMEANVGYEDAKQGIGMSEAASACQHLVGG